MTQQELEAILRDGDPGEIIGGAQVLEDGTVVWPEMSYNAVLLLAERYLIRGKDTDALRHAPIDWTGHPMVEAKGDLPEMWAIMPKGLLLNYFHWKGEFKKSDAT